MSLVQKTIGAEKKSGFIASGKSQAQVRQEVAQLYGCEPHTQVVISPSAEAFVKSLSYYSNNGRKPFSSLSYMATDHYFAVKCEPKDQARDTFYFAILR